MKFQIHIFDDEKEYADIVMDENTGTTIKVAKKCVSIDIKTDDIT